MPLYNQMVNTAIDISKIADKLNQLSYEKAREDLIVQTAKMYYLAQNMAAMSAKGKVQVQATLITIKEMAGWTFYGCLIYAWQYGCWHASLLYPLSEFLYCDTYRA